MSLLNHHPALYPAQSIHESFVVGLLHSSHRKFQLLSIINTSFKEGKFPKCLKTAIVTLLLKKTNLDTEQLKNYRPVSKLPFLSKVLEKIAVKRLLHEVNQSAYNRQHSTETALLKVQDDIACALDKNKAVAFVKLDLSAAFDTADHNQLLSVLGIGSLN